MSGTAVFSPWGLAVGGFLASLAVSVLWRRFAMRRQLLDVPDLRRLHTVPTPRGGGIGIALVMLLCAPWLGPGAGLFALGLALTAGGGLLDDLRPLPALPKLALQCLGALPLAVAWPLLPSLLGPLVSVLAAWWLVLVLVNFWNFMDGSNGLAASQALLAGLALVLLAGPGSPAGWLALALVAGCLGFLPHNLPQARLFLGDVGSYALGYGVAACALMAMSAGTASAWTLLLLASACLIDAGLTLLGRLRRRQKFWLPHREHLYQRAVANGWSHAGICAAYAAWTIAAAGFALGLAASSPVLQMLALAGFSAAGILLYLWAGRRWPLPHPANEMESVG